MTDESLTKEEMKVLVVEIAEDLMMTAKKCLIRDRSLIPVAAHLTPGGIALQRLKFRNPREKAVEMEIVAMTAQLMDSVAVLLVTETWLVKRDKDHLPKEGERIVPEESKDRREAIVIQIKTRDFEGVLMQEYESRETGVEFVGDARLVEKGVENNLLSGVLAERPH